MPINELIVDYLVSDEFIRFYSISQHLTIACSFLTFGLLVFVILHAFTEAMRTYKWFLLHEAFWNLMVILFISTWQVVSLFSLGCGFSGSAWIRYTSANVSQTFFQVIAFCCFGKGMVMAATLAHRFSQIIPEGNGILRLYNRLTPWLEVTSFIIGEIILAPFFYTSAERQAEIRRELKTSDIVMNKIYKDEPTVICIAPYEAPYYPTQYTNNLVCLAVCVTSLHSIADCIILLYFIKPYRQYLLRFWTQCCKRQIALRSYRPSFTDNWITHKPRLSVVPVAWHYNPSVYLFGYPPHLDHHDHESHGHDGEWGSRHADGWGDNHADAHDHARESGYENGDQSDWSRLDYGGHKQHARGDEYARGYANEHGDSHGAEDGWSNGHDSGYGAHLAQEHRDEPHHYEPRYGNYNKWF
ncbi:hypothetical protein M3Y98_00683000 [Aphelenchoides besseyi]|nr:hypothetical protein M3Y98_00683000 [Aphelenchoides besseyi]